MQWIAMLTMLIDHIGVIFFPEQVAFRIIGRLAFPIYVYLAVLGYQRTSSISRYMLRLTLLALASQLPFMLAFSSSGINVIGTLAIGIATIKCIDYFKHRAYIYIPITVLAIAVLDFFPFDYGSYGLLLMLIYRYLMQKPAILLLAHFLLEIVFLVFYKWGIQYFSMLVTLAITVYYPLIKQLDRLRAPNWLWRLFYPLHLAVLYLIVKLMLVN